MAVRLASGTVLKKAALHYTTDTGLRSKRVWTTVQGSFSKSVTDTDAGGLGQVQEVTAPSPPAEANTWFLSVTDDRDAMVSTEVQFR